MGIFRYIILKIENANDCISNKEKINIDARLTFLSILYTIYIHCVCERKCNRLHLLYSLPLWFVNTFSFFWYVKNKQVLFVPIA